MQAPASYLAPVPASAPDAWELRLLRHAKAWRRARVTGDGQAMMRAHLGLLAALQERDMESDSGK